MKVWVKVGTFAKTQIEVEGNPPFIDDLKRAIKLDMQNAFQTTDKGNIIIRDRITNEEIDSTATLALPNGIERGTAGNPYIVDGPQQGVF